MIYDLSTLINFYILLIILSLHYELHLKYCSFAYIVIYLADLLVLYNFVHLEASYDYFI